MGATMSRQPYPERRLALMRRLPDGLILVPGAISGRLNLNFLYLTGISEPRGALLLAPQGVRAFTGRLYPGPDYVRGRMVGQMLFLPARDPLASRWGEDSAATVEQASAEERGVDALFAASELETMLTAALQSAELLYYVRGAAPALGGGDDSDSAFVARLRRRFFDLSVRDGSPAVHEMRRLKDEGEIAAMERAAAATAEAMATVMSNARSGMKEYELEAEITRIYRKRGGSHAFDPIVACGDNALKLHYSDNSGPLEQGKLMVVDTGASIDGYKADVTRTLPIGGKFSDRQREVYEVALAAELEAIAAARPGVLLGDLHARAYGVIDDAGLGEYFVHGLGHYLGLEAHDVGDYHRPLEQGAVITAEPGIYIPEEGIGVRIEDDLLITESGCRVLSEAIPKSVEDVERAMAD
jgi:Xaa-Pro aminopeptidase